MPHQENPYQAPQANLETAQGVILASRGSRLAASIIDAVVMMLIQFPILYAYGYFDGMWEGVEPTLQQEVVAGIIGMGSFLLLNGFLLQKYGQTLGKRLLGISIRDAQGRICPFLPMFCKRILIWSLLLYLPYLLGFVVVLIDCLLIFRGDRKCLHDLVAGTQVVTVLRNEPEPAPGQTF